MNWFAKQRVLVPIDFSDQSMAAVDIALDAVDGPAGLHVLHVLPVLTAVEPAFVWDAGSDETRRQGMETVLRDRLGSEKYRGAKIVVTLGDPGQEIADFALNVKAEMIVMPSHGRTGLKRLLIGSVAERVCRLAHCPVLVLRT